MTRPPSPYLEPGFYDRALRDGRHRDIVGGRWDETGRLQMALLTAQGLKPHHQLLDVGAGSLRLGCKAVPYLDPGHYWGTDASRALMLRGREVELPDPDCLPADHLVEDADFAFPGLPDRMDYVIAFGVFTHLPTHQTADALAKIARRWPAPRVFLFTVFLAPAGQEGASLRQPDGVVTHPDRPPYHLTETMLQAMADAAGLTITRQPDRLPRGQVLFCA
ncbi:class I SAM-dependent methyltransferase [Roseicyclus sp.]|uniref:class I SAM-dependent methyltransferase n=1 Tax=Roseicyclus sp. TaxID=1914329 RepID=UPI003F6BC2E0